MNIETYIQYLIILLVIAIITFSVIGYAIVKKDFSKKMDTIILTVFMVDGFILLLLAVITWL